MSAIENWRYRVRLAVVAAEGTKAEALLRPLLELTDEQVQAVCFLLSVQQQP